MGYNVIDIIDKVINIAIRNKRQYENIGKEKSYIESIKIMSIVLSKQEDKAIQYYETLKKEIGNMEFEEIDFVIYDKISFLINEFNKKIYATDINNVKDYLKFSFDLERDAQALLIDIQGRLVKNTSDIHKKTYKILSEIINNNDSHISTLEKILNR